MSKKKRLSLQERAKLIENMLKGGDDEDIALYNASGIGRYNHGHGHKSDLISVFPEEKTIPFRYAPEIDPTLEMMNFLAPRTRLPQSDGRFAPFILDPYNAGYNVDTFLMGRIERKRKRPDSYTTFLLHAMPKNLRRWRAP